MARFLFPCLSFSQCKVAHAGLLFPVGGTDIPGRLARGVPGGPRLASYAPRSLGWCRMVLGRPIRWLWPG